MLHSPWQPVSFCGPWRLVLGFKGPFLNTLPMRSTFLLPFHLHAETRVCVWGSEKLEEGKLQCQCGPLTISWMLCWSSYSLENQSFLKWTKGLDLFTWQGCSKDQILKWTKGLDLFTWQGCSKDQMSYVPEFVKDAMLDRGLFECFYKCLLGASCTWTLGDDDKIHVPGSGPGPWTRFSMLRNS
jgi:hypothetical protein